MATPTPDYNRCRQFDPQFGLLSRKRWLCGPKERTMAMHIGQRGISAASQRRRLIMTTRSRRETVTFRHPFRIRGIDRELPAGAYEVITDEEMIEGLSFASFRRVATMIMVPAAAGNATTEMVSIGSIDLSDAQRIDASAPHE
jgi:hypothetical protein